MLAGTARPAVQLRALNSMQLSPAPGLPREEAPVRGSDPLRGQAPPGHRPARPARTPGRAPMSPVLEKTPLTLHAETAADLMTPSPVSIREDASIREAI